MNERGYWSREQKKAIGGYVRAWRKARGWNQERLALQMGVRRPTVTRIENGTLGMSHTTKAALFAVLGMSEEELLATAGAFAAIETRVWREDCSAPHCPGVLTITAADILAGCNCPVCGEVYRIEIEAADGQGSVDRLLAAEPRLILWRKVRRPQSHAR